MRLQSAVEFISTYGFMFLILTLVIALVLFLASYNGTAPTTQCNSFSTLTCNYANFYPNVTYGHGELTLSFTNDQNTPINITSISTTLDNYTILGVCSPNFLYPGQESSCLSSIPINSITLSLHNGQYQVKAGYCNSGIAFLNSTSCIYSNVTYAGTFQVYNNPNDTTPFSVIAGLIPPSNQLPNLLSTPIMTANNLIVQNGDLVALRNLTGMGYAFGTSSFLTSSYFGMNVLPFPSVISTLNNNAITCSSPFNSLISISYSNFFIPATKTIQFKAYADNAIEIYYKLNTSTTWSSAFAGAGWTTGTPSTQSTTHSLTAGLYQLAVAWANTCGNGVQAMSINGIGQ